MRIVKATKTASSTRTIPMCSELVTIMKAHAYAQKLERMKNISCYKNRRLRICYKIWWYVGLSFCDTKISSISKKSKYRYY
ncbi:hypothetical protein [Clostridium sp. MD294]|uniref:hypothetical protein n=1 Tax=Clostridium sp. MD294 TaxID=97138 RepID=UPI00138F6BB6|nr:hypothetical protein [Clostridium sp. MD294]